ncbi:hypothetical protein CBM2634_A220018 [Cupriavidus taiwanensis]|uniref:Uncharacterized protein n=1 Tax=Cupriavidus taiwanensis TaxID=164546 RepID=A0A375IYB6_9BURK|nr:hypothetical protein CBM2634_A220018 [Cupriavidus taiwanensis]
MCRDICSVSAIAAAAPGSFPCQPNRKVTGSVSCKQRNSDRLALYQHVLFSCLPWRAITAHPMTNAATNTRQPLDLDVVSS